MGVLILLKKNTWLQNEDIKHLKTDWSRYGFETIAVIVGILIAFALENWNEERQAKDQADTFLHHIASNIDEDLEELKALMIYVDRSKER